MTCEADEVKDEEQEGGPPAETKKGHGGCGHHQPQVRKEGLKLFFSYKKQNDEEVGLLDLRLFVTFDSLHLGLPPHGPG